MKSEFELSAQSDDPDVEWSEESMEFDPDLIQQVTRIQRPEIDQLIGYYRASFATGQKREVVHILLHPPMEQVPEVQATALDAPPHRIRITDHERFGVRLEVVLDQPWDRDDRGAFMIEVLASAARRQTETA